LPVKATCAANDPVLFEDSQIMGITSRVSKGWSSTVLVSVPGPGSGINRWQKINPLRLTSTHSVGPKLAILQAPIFQLRHF
jgi:hypothetical protein